MLKLLGEICRRLGWCSGSRSDLSHLRQSSYLSPRQIDELREVLAPWLQTGRIKFEQPAVAHYDSVTAGVPLRESLTVRGWL
ncbi:MAG: hypothetical protein IPM93_22720 [Candidatus Obscuribacter sp.]|nr:hypothetical protein [Candidatus Obscuribacter sp.]